MFSAKGIISDRLRALFTSDQILHNAHPDRSATPASKPIPKGVKGVQDSQPGRTVKKKK